MGILVFAGGAHAAEGDELVDDALEDRQELAQARADVRAAQERVPQAESWP